MTTEPFKHADKSWDWALEKIARLTKEVERLDRALALLKKLHPGHDDCEDSWYSCPKHPECTNNNYDGMPIEGRPCYCGYDAVQALLEESDV